MYIFIEVISIAGNVPGQFSKLCIPYFGVFLSVLALIPQLLFAYEKCLLFANGALAHSIVSSLHLFIEFIYSFIFDILFIYYNFKIFFNNLQSLAYLNWRLKIYIFMCFFGKCAQHGFFLLIIGKSHMLLERKI